MGTCFVWIILIVAGAFSMISVIRWFEQTIDAVDQRLWNRLVLLVVVPPAVWFYRSRVSIGRPVPVAKYEPVRGFGALPKGGIQEPPAIEPEASVPIAQRADDDVPPGPPPSPPLGTPKEFLGMPKIPPKKAPRAVDPDKLAKLRQKMKEQGMLSPDAEKEEPGKESGNKSGEESGADQ